MASEIYGFHLFAFVARDHRRRAMDRIFLGLSMNLSQILPFAFFRWAQSTGLALFIKQSMWAFAIIETIHIVCLSILLGSTLLVDLRLLGKGLTGQSVAEISRTLLPWTWVMLVVIVVTGVMMFSSEAVRLGQSEPFFFKMIFLFLAVLFHSTIHRKVTGSDAPEGAGTGKAKIAAYLSLVCWLSVALAGRAIAFF